MSKETVLIAQMLAEHGANPDSRLWRNETGVFWAGKQVMANRTLHPMYPISLMPGQVVLSNSARISAGLCVGSSDLIGIAPGGLFLAGEVKTPRTKVTPAQPKFVQAVRDLGGVAGFVRTVDELGRLLKGEMLDG
jgi:hypothetical protein